MDEFNEQQIAEAFSLYGTPRTYSQVIQEDGITVDGMTRKQRIVSKLDGTPTKGTVIIVCRGTQDLQDWLSDTSFGLAGQTPAESLDDNNSYYKNEIKPHVQRILTTQFTRQGSSAYNYKQDWDVFATGHSLGGALAEQLIMDGLAKGGMSFAAPRTLRSDRERPAYSIISSGDLVISRTGTAADSVYDFSNPEYTTKKLSKDGKVMDAAFHGHDPMSLGTIEAADGGPLWNNSKYFDQEITKFNDEYDPITGSFVDRIDVFRPPKPATPVGPPVLEPDPSAEPSFLNPAYEAAKTGISAIKEGVSNIASKAKRIFTGEESPVTPEVGKGINRKRGAGPAPRANYMRRMVRNIYKPSAQTLEGLAETGLELPEYRYTKKKGYLSNGGVSVQFYIITTPTNIVAYYNMPVFNVVKQQILRLAEGKDPDEVVKYIGLLEKNAGI